jgi:hypothetical protein
VASIPEREVADLIAGYSPSSMWCMKPAIDW